MDKRNWTIPQRDAFEAKQGDLLVCAAAGSGKTAVLTERVIRSLTAEDPVDITRMLIVTFTKAAAAELKERISRAITEKMGEEQGSLRLQRQLLALDRAQITTIDSFCKGLISGYFTELGLPASPRIADEAEGSLLRRQTMENLLDRLYEEESAGFLALVRLLTNLRDDGLSDILLKVYQTVSAYPEGVEYIRAAAEKLRAAAENGITDSDFGRQLDRQLTAMLTHYKNIYRTLLDGLDGEDSPKAVAAFQDELAEMEACLNAPDPTERSRRFCALEFPRLPSNDNKSENYRQLFDLRPKYKDDVDALKPVFAQSERDQRIAADRSARLCTTLYHVLNRFEEAYQSEKKRLGILDFIDMERYAYRLLVKDGKPTAVAGVVAGCYDQIYIDEYQDSNRLQDEIFRAISRNNRFMVGDIKQSIYGFRGAVPDLFAEYRSTFPNYDRANPGQSGKIFLSHNFRSTKPIITFVNAIFDRLFVSNSGRIPYVSRDDALRFPDDRDPTVGLPVRFTLIRGSRGEVDPEADYVADRIVEQIAAGRNPGEIAILMRSPKKGGKAFEEALHQRGIPTESSVDEDFWGRPEILLMLGLLGAIDNPRRDIYLAGAMKSPIFGITLEDLILLKRNHPGDCLYDSLTAAADAGDFPKGAAFLRFLNELREDSRLSSVDKLIRKIYRLTALPALVGGNPDCGREGADRLRRLYAFAHSFESGSFRGLHNFMRYLTDARNGELSPTIAKPGQGKDCVKILSIHNSKGLEFPVVYLCRTDKQVNTDDLKKPLLMERELGIALRLRDESGFASYDPAIRRSVASRILENLMDEEMRNLYVALTRPREELHITACVSDFKKADALIMGSRWLDFYGLSKNPTYLAWLLAALGKDQSVCRMEYYDPEEAAEKDENEPTVPFSDTASDILRPDAAESADPAADAALREMLQSRLNYVYPYQAQLSIPTKAVVSELYPSYLDESQEPDIRYHFHAKPAFLEPSKEPTGAERGTATHLFMQFCDFSAVERFGVQAELARLTDRGFIDREQAAMVYTDKLSAFFESALFRQMSQSPELHREYRFLLSKPAGEFTENSELAGQIADARLLVQGVIDCFFLLPDGSYKLVDYKTDRVRGKSDPELAAQALVEEYGNQLRYYREAIEQISGKKVSETAIFAFDLGREIVISPD